MPKFYNFFQTENSQQNCKLLFLPYDLRKLIFSFFSTNEMHDLVNFSLTSQKSRRLSQERLNELINLFTLEATSLPIKTLLALSLQVGVDELEQFTSKLASEDENALRELNCALQNTNKLENQIAKLEEIKSDPGCCIDVNPMSKREKMIATTGLPLLFLGLILLAWAIEKKTKSPVFATVFGVFSLLSLFLATLCAVRGQHLLRSLDDAKQNLNVQLDSSFLANSSGKITRTHVPQLDIQYDGDDLEAAQPNLNEDLTETSPLLVCKPR